MVEDINSNNSHSLLILPHIYNNAKFPLRIVPARENEEFLLPQDKKHSRQRCTRRLFLLLQQLLKKPWPPPYFCGGQCYSFIINLAQTTPPTLPTPETNKQTKNPWL